MSVILKSAGLVWTNEELAALEGSELEGRDVNIDDYEARHVQSRQALVRFLEDLAKSVDEEPRFQYSTVHQYLKALAEWFDSADSWRANMQRYNPDLAIDVNDPSWELFARALRVARTFG